MLANTIVNPLVMAAEDDKIPGERQGIGNGLIEGLAIRGHENHIIIFTLSFQSRDTGVDRLNTHYHTGLAAKRIIIDLTMLIESIVAEIMDIDLREPLVLSTTDDRIIERRLKHLRDYSNDIDSHDAKLRK